jgi:hypothetical protein
VLSFCFGCIDGTKADGAGCETHHITFSTRSYRNVNFYIVYYFLSTPLQMCSIAFVLLCVCVVLPPRISVNKCGMRIKLLMFTGYCKVSLEFGSCRSLPADV